MKNDLAEMDRFNKEKALKDLMEDLNLFSDSANDDTQAAEDSLDLVVDQALSGIDIRKRFPAFYKKLLRNKNLRQQFIDAISQIVGGKDAVNDPHLQKAGLDFSFLKKNQPRLSSWPIFITQEKEQLMNIFFPVQVVYRDGGNIGSSLVYTLLRKDFVLGTTTYTVVLESSLSDGEEEALHASLSLTTNEDNSKAAFPVQASLRWGDYSNELLLNEEGKHSLPDIPLSAVFTAELDQVKSDLFLSLNPIAN